MFGGLRKKLNDVWSGADFWDEKENRAQRVQAARPAQAVKAPPIQTVSRQNAPQAPASIRRISQPQPQQRTTNQLIDKSYGDGVTGMFNKYVRDTFDANTEADKIRRQANTGLSETYKQEQARKTASAVNTKQGRNTLNQFASGGLAGAADFFGKAPGSAMQVQGRVSKAINSIDNPIVRTGVKLVAAPQTLFQGEKEANKQLEAGKQLSSLVENKKQQSGIGNRRDDNRLAYGAGQVTTQLPAQIATGGLGLANTGLQTTADEANRAQAKGKSNNQALGIGALQGSVSAASEKFGIDKFVPGSGTSSRLVNAGKRVLTEGGQEAQQQFTQNLIANKTYDPNQSLKEGVAESAVLGGLAGGVMSPVADFKAPKRPTTNLVSKPAPTPQPSLNKNEAYTLSDQQEVNLGRIKDPRTVNAVSRDAFNIAKRNGIDITSGSPREINDRINSVLEQPQNNRRFFKPLNEGGYIQTPGRTNDIETIQKSIVDRYPGVELDVFDNGKRISLSKIVVPKAQRNSGIGSKIMQELSVYADSVGKPIDLTPTSDYGGSVTKLKDFYKKQGYVQNKGKNKDFQTREEYYRLPQNKPTNKLFKPLDQRGSIQVPGGKDVDPLESLKQEARKYKSELDELEKIKEQFVQKYGDTSQFSAKYADRYLKLRDELLPKAEDAIIETQGLKKVYHGTTHKWEGDFKEKDTFFTPNKKFAENVADEQVGNITEKLDTDTSPDGTSYYPTIVERYLPKDSKIFDATNKADIDLLANKLPENVKITTFIGGEANMPKSEVLDLLANDKNSWQLFEGEIKNIIRKNGYDGWKASEKGYESIGLFNPNNTLKKQQLTDLYNQATQSQPPKSTFEQNLEQAGVKPKNGLVLSERKNLDGTITQKVRTGKGQVEERVVRDTQLSKLEKQKRQIVDAEARPIYDNDKQRAQKQKDLRKQIIAKGGIGSSDYETFPKSLKRKGGQSLDEIATELGFNSDEELMKELDSYKQPQKLDDIREVVQDELANGNKELSGDYARLLQQIDDRKAELLRYPNGSRVTKNRQNFPTEDEFMNLMSSAEASDPNNKTKSAVSTATRDIKSEQRQAVLEGDLQKAQQLRQQVGQIETGLERKAPDLSQNVDETIKEAPQIRSIKDKSVKQAFEVLTKQYLGTKNATKIERDVTIKNLESKYKLNDAEKLNAILAGDSATVKPMNQKVADYLREFRNNTDTAYKRYTEAGEKMGYVSSYLPHIYKNRQTGQLLDATEFELLQRASARTRGREADVVATDWLVEKDPTKLLERYYQSMDNAVAGKNYLKQLQNSGIVTASSEPVRGLRPIVAEGMQSDDGMIYYAPKDVATKLNNLFGANEANNLVEKALEKGSGLNSLFQSFVLSGGIPNTPINSFGMMQVMKEGMALHPVKAGKAITAGFSKRYADKVFTAKKDYLKMMAANDIDIRVDLTQTGKSGTRRTIEAFKEGKAKGLNQAWNEFTNDSTFSRFMPMLEVTHFENIYKKAIRKNTPERAAQIAAESVKNFYGKTGNYKPAVRGKVVDDFYGAAFFAPRFRESMINFWGKNIKALNPKNYGKLEYRDNQKFLVASALTYTAMTLLNEALNGVQMWDNPDDKKDKLILPADKLKEFGINTEGKDIGIPFLSSIATVPRNAVSGLASLASGDLQSAGKRAKSFLSMPLNSAGDLITNEDYFGNQIVKDDVKGLDRFSQMASYTAGRNMQPWLREGLNKAGGGLSDDLKKKLGIKEKGSFETFSNALESPLRFYDPKYYRYSEQWAPRGGKNEKFDFAEQRARSGVKKQIDSIPGELGLSNTQKAAFKALNTYNFDSDGNLKLDNDPFYQAKRATALQDDGVFEAMKKRAQLENKLNGKPIDPLYSLPPSARRIILWKKTLPQGTSDPTIKQIYGQEWYQDYRGQEAKYFADKRVYNKKMGYKDSSGTDTNPYPDASPQVAQKLDYYYTLPSGTGARSRFLEANPDVLAQWDAVENWKNGERAQVGLGEIGDDNKYAYGKSSGGKGGRKGKGRGGRGGRGGKASSKYDYTKDLFGSGGNIDSNNNTKALRAILAKAMSGKS